MAAAKEPEKRKFGEITRLSTGRYRARYRGPDGERHNAPVTFLSRFDAETVVVGTAITHPATITSWFAEQVRDAAGA